MICNILSFRILLLFCSIILIAQCSTIQRLKSLREHLFTTNSYDKFLRPKENQSEEVLIRLDFNLKSIHNLDEVAQTLTTTAILGIYWTDESLKWNATEYGFTQLVLPQTEIWKPEIVLSNGAQKLYQLGDDFLQVIIDYKGNVEWRPFEVFTSKCTVDMTYYPYDTQTCSVEFTNWNTGPTYTRIKLGDFGLQYQDLTDSSGWDVIEFKEEVQNSNGIITVAFSITMKRKSEYFTVNMVFPVLILGTLDVFTFVLPASAGEKMSFSVTIYLAFAVFLNVVSSLLPASSKSVCIMSVYLLYHLSQGALIIIITCVQLRMLDWKDIKSIPRFLHFVTVYSFKLRCRSRSKINSNNHETEIKNQIDENFNDGNDIKKNNQKKQPMLSKSQSILEIKRKRMDVPPSPAVYTTENKYVITWSDVSAALDFYFFVIFITILLVITTAIFLI